MARYADILIPLRLYFELLTYQISDSEEFASLCEGETVAVEMGATSTKFYTGIVWRIHDQKPNYKVIRTIYKRLYNTVLLPEEHRKFWAWLADYYLCTMGEVMSVALPSLCKPTAKDQEAFELAEYTPSKELYIKILEVETPPKLLRGVATAYEEITSCGKSLHTRDGEIARRLVGCTTPQLRSLEQRGLISLTERQRNIESVGNISFELPHLTPHQNEALEAIKSGHTTHNCCLLQGVTGSGKTEVYIHLIAEQLAAGRDVLMLVPEIALTTQLIERMRIVFGSRVLPYHSKITAKVRTETFMRLAQNRDGGNFIVGARSAIFLPLNNLGLIVIDEEHDASYKQVDPSPRYNARDSAHILAALYGAKVLLGSATPSLESWTNATTGKFAMAKLTERYGDAQLPKIIISDTQRAARRGERRGHFNLELLSRIKDRTERGEQTILFQNRRGFAPYVECPDCGWVARCPHCNVSLTMHKTRSALRCHYCDYSIILPTSCPSCSVGVPHPMGFGTEKIEEQIGELIPSARTVRMDRDTAISPIALERIVGSFSRQESDIMVGTQMVAKGFDFSNVTLVGVLNADNMLLTPDFRAEERAFALLTQVSGRAGRRGSNTESEVVIQSSQPSHRIIECVVDNDYERMAHMLLAEREAFFYPPYSRITMLTLQHNDNARLYRGANALSALLRERFGGRVRGPVPPPVDRIRGEWLVSFMVKIESGASSKRARELLREALAKWRDTKEFNAIIVNCNVDPQ